MDPIKNPYSPGAGTPPPELAGRSELITRAIIAIERIRSRRAARSFIYYGLRGVGKTVLLNKIRQDAEARDCACVWVEAPEDRSLPALLLPPLRAALIKLSAGEATRAALKKAFIALSGFASAMKVKYNDIELVLDYRPEKGVADSGDLENDLVELFSKIGEAALEKGTIVSIFIDELQYLEGAQLAALITALHRISQNQLPVTMVAAGLPQVLGQTGKAKSYAERLFEFIRIGSLDEIAAKDALCLPAKKENVAFEDGAIAEILKRTQCYPYFLQEWGKHSWDIARDASIRLADVKIATITALAELDSSFFRVRFDRLTPAEKRYVRAMAELGPGPHRSGDIAEKLGRAVSSVAPLRSQLIAKGMVYSPAFGDTDFTVPLFEGFLKRIMPQLE